MAPWPAPGSGPGWKGASGERGRFGTCTIGGQRGAAERRSGGAARVEPLPGRAGRVPGTLGAVPPALGVPWRAAYLTALPVWWEADADQVISATRHLKRTRSAPRESLPGDRPGPRNALHKPNALPVGIHNITLAQGTGRQGESRAEAWQHQQWRF